MEIKKRSNIVGSNYFFLIVSGLMSFDPGWFTKFVFLFLITKNLIIFNYLKTTIKLIYNEEILDYSSKFVKKKLRKKKINMISAIKIKKDKCGHLVFNCDYMTTSQIYSLSLLTKPGYFYRNNKTIAIPDVSNVELEFYNYLNQIYNLKKGSISGLEINRYDIKLIFSKTDLLVIKSNSVSYIPNVKKYYKFKKNKFVNIYKQNSFILFGEIPFLYEIELTDEETKKIKEHLNWD